MKNRLHARTVLGLTGFMAAPGLLMAAEVMWKCRRMYRDVAFVYVRVEICVEVDRS